MTFEEILEQAIAMLQRRGRLTYRALKRQFDLDDAYLDDLKHEIIEGQRLAVDEHGTVLIWTGTADPALTSAAVPERAPLYLIRCISRRKSSLPACPGRRAQTGGAVCRYQRLDGADCQPRPGSGSTPRPGPAPDDGCAPLRRPVNQVLAMEHGPVRGARGMRRIAARAHGTAWPCRRPSQCWC